ncbi:DNA-primase RepB domain-containing protein [Ottowia sp.]|uniref:DNA-primase RepB domain-containing protein n=1 Tax=Ottowia sp. TaxID=1898956 RepID=UPI0039E5D183
MTALHPDINHARLFLELLDAAPNSFTFQFFPERPGSNVYARTLHGSLDQHADTLIKANLSGAGICVMVNAGDQRGRKAENVHRVRAHYVDLDKCGIDPLFTAELPPHIVVESSPGKWHAYWLAAPETPLDEFPAVQKALAKRFSGDPAVSDPSRVMRLPGFYHQKKEPFMTLMQQGKDI